MLTASLEYLVSGRRLQFCWSFSQGGEDEGCGGREMRGDGRGSIVHPARGGIQVHSLHLVGQLVDIPLQHLAFLAQRAFLPSLQLLLPQSTRQCLVQFPLSF